CLFIYQLSLCSQLYVAYRNEKVDEALSLSFLICQTGGDLADFSFGYYFCGCPSLFTTPFYRHMGVTMLSQFVYYKLKNQKKT
ncbi:hypothetical protein MC885_017264, partial [Smutsia gigantea]